MVLGANRLLLLRVGCSSSRIYLPLITRYGRVGMSNEISNR